MNRLLAGGPQAALATARRRAEPPKAIPPHVHGQATSATIRHSAESAARVPPCGSKGSVEPGPAQPEPSSAFFLARHVARCRRSEEHTSELQSLMRLSYAVFCLKKKKNKPYK